MIYEKIRGLMIYSELVGLSAMRNGFRAGHFHVMDTNLTHFMACGFESWQVGSKRSYISLGGRIILIKGVLSNILVYYMSMYKIPMKVVFASEMF